MAGKGKGKKKDLRGKVPALGEEDGDKDLVAGGHLAELLRQVVVLRLREGVELLVVVDGDDGHAAAVLEADDRGRRSRVRGGGRRCHYRGWWRGRE